MEARTRAAVNLGTETRVKRLPGGSQRDGPKTLPSLEFGPLLSPMSRSWASDLYDPKVLQSSRGPFYKGALLFWQTLQGSGT